MKNKIYVIIIYFIFFFKLTNLNAQSLTLFGDKTYGGDKWELAQTVLYSGNNTLVLGGTSSTGINGDKTELCCPSGFVNQPDIWLLKIDTALNILWQNDLGASAEERFPALNLINQGSNAIFSCTTNSDSSCDKTEHIRGSIGTTDYWICFMDSAGNKTWDKTLGGGWNDFAPKTIQLSAGDLIVCGVSSSLPGYDKTVYNHGGGQNGDFWAIKLDTLGNKIWDKVYGGSLNEWSANIIYENWMSLLACSGGDFIIAGASNSPADGDVSDTCRGGYDIWIIKNDSAGMKIWDKRYGGSGKDQCIDIKPTSDNGYILCGFTESPQDGDVSEPSRGMKDCWVIKTDSLGNKQWDKRYGGSNNDVANWIEPAPGGGYWVSGYTSSSNGFEVTEPSYGNADYWIFKIDSTGNKLWDKRFGGPGDDFGSSFVIMPDSSIFLFGTGDPGTSAVKTDPGKGFSDYWLVHFKYGYPVFVAENEWSVVSGQLSVVPNPVKDVCTINLPGSSTLQHSNTLTLYDITGRALLQQAFNGTAQIDVSGLARGMYIAVVRYKKGNSAKGKLLKE